jgi:hypothetical protein
MEHITAAVIRDISGLEQIRGWWTAWQRHPNSDIDFYSTVLRTVPGIVRPHVIVVYDRGTPQGILVGRIEDTDLAFNIGYGRFFRSHARVLTLIHRGLLGNVSTSSCQVIVREIMNSLREGEADVAYFNLLRSDSPLYAVALRTPGVLSRDHFSNTQPHHCMELPTSLEQLASQLSRKVRKNQRWNKLLRDYPNNVMIKSFRGTEDLEYIFQVAEGIAQRSYHRGLGVGFVDSPETRKLLRAQAEHGWLRCHILYVGGKPCAFWIGTLYHGTFNSDYMAYDTNYGQYSPGMFLIMRIVEVFCGPNSLDRVSRIDFGQGDAEWKAHLGNQEWFEAPIYIFAPTLKGLRLNSLRMPAILVNKVGRTVLERTQLLARLKKEWRKHLAQKASEHPPVSDKAGPA